jgi:hypothetical protein
MGYASKGILVFNLKYEHAISFINLVKFIIKIVTGFKQIVMTPVLVTLWPTSGHNFERHHNNLSSVNYLMITVKIERAFIHFGGHDNLFKTRNNALINIWAMLQKEYWCLIWNMNMQSASSIWSNLLSNATVNIHVSSKLFVIASAEANVYGSSYLNQCL